MKHQKDLRRKALHIIFFLFFGFYSLQLQAQCPAATGENQNIYGSGSWIGYVYDGTTNYTDYQGHITESEMFDESFCGDNCDFTTSACDVTTSTFTVRYRMLQSFTNALYRITVGGDDGVRLSLDGGANYTLGAYSLHSYNTYSTVTALNGSYNMVLDYYENDGQNRVSFSYTNEGDAYGGLIGSSQSFCQSGTADPAAFTSIENAAFLSGATAQYQWQKSYDNTNWIDIPSATGVTYDLSAAEVGTTYYRRRAYDGSSIYDYSNTVTIDAYSTDGDQVSYGSEQWIGYVYDGANNFNTNYIGTIDESEIFDETFGGNNVTYSTNGCGVNTQTFSVRFKMTKDFTCGDYKFTIGGDDGVRLSIDGGSTYLIDDYSDHAYRTNTSTTISLDGSYDLVLEFYENTGENHVSFSYTQVSSCLLPVEYSYFEVKPEEHSNVLEWATTSEINNLGFEVERSNDGIQFETMGWVDGNGTTHTPREYSFTDKNPENGWSYYRLKQIDLDGEFEYSRMKSAYQTQQEIVEIYPNPAKDFVIIRNCDARYSYSMINSITLEEIPAIRNNSGLEFRFEKAGTYILTVNTGDEIVKERIVVIK